MVSYHLAMWLLWQLNNVGGKEMNKEEFATKYGYGDDDFKDMFLSDLNALLRNERLEFCREIEILLKDGIKTRTYQTRFDIPCDFPQDKVDTMIDEILAEYLKTE